MNKFYVSTKNSIKGNNHISLLVCNLWPLFFKISFTNSYSNVVFVMFEILVLPGLLESLFLCHLIAPRAWTNYLATLSLSFLIHKVKTIRLTSQVCR